MGVTLANNALSGTLHPDISSLDLLEVLDLSDNDMKGRIPIEIGLLSNLKYLRLCFNSFVGNETNFGNNMKKLELIQLHGNRLSGEIPSFGWAIDDRSSFVSDCGSPSNFEDALICEDCTMCCNLQGDCYPNELTEVATWGFVDYRDFTIYVFACVFGISVVIIVGSYIHDRFIKLRHLPSASLRELRAQDTDSRYAIDVIGDDSVYQLFLGNSILGWIVTLGTVYAQGWLLWTFVKAAEIDLSDDRSDLVYTYMCPRDNPECRNTGDLTEEGWIAFAILMGANILKDIIDGGKLIILSGKRRNSHLIRCRLFIGGTVLFMISIYTLYVSVIYNVAIATSNTEMIMNSVVIIFICDMDELVFDILMTINPGWVERSSYQEPVQPVIENQKRDTDEETNVKETNITESEKNTVLEGAVQNLEHEVHMLKKDVAEQNEEVKTLHKTLEMVLEKNAELSRLLMSSKDTSSNK